MAIRERKGRAKPWQVYWNNPFTGKRESECFATRQEAEKHDSLIKHRMKFERESFRRENLEETKVTTLEAAYIMYLNEKQFPAQSMARQVSAMRPALCKLGDMPIAEITRENLEELLCQLQATGVKPVTTVHKMKKLKTLFIWAANAGLCEMPKFPTLPKCQYEKFVPPTPAELQSMYDAAPDHIKRVIILGSQCGVRVGPCEMFQLTWSDVDLDQSILRVHGSRKNPNAPWREVPIRESLIGLFMEWKAEDMKSGCQYLIHYKGKPVRSIAEAWKTTLYWASIERRIRPYDLRHAFATELIAGGADIGTVARLMGHNSPSMVFNHYQFVMDRQKRAAIEKLPDLQNVPKPMCPKRRGYKNVWKVVDIPQ